MWRTSAVRDMLLDDLCSLPKGKQLESAASDVEASMRRLSRARQRAVLVIAVDWIALLILFLLRSEAAPWLTLGPAQESVFTLGVLAVAAHSGFRLGQLDKLRAVGRLIEELDERSTES